LFTISIIIILRNIIICIINNKLDLLFYLNFLFKYYTKFIYSKWIRFHLAVYLKQKDIKILSKKKEGKNIFGELKEKTMVL
jgi:hypothetical protein